VPDYFEIERLIEDLAKIYSTACATSWFKVIGNKHPTKEEFRNKVVTFMRHFDYTLSLFPKSQEADQFRSYSMEILESKIREVLSGDNKEVEKRYKYYVDYSWIPSVNYSFKAYVIISASFICIFSTTTWILKNSSPALDTKNSREMTFMMERKV
jgi:hypothetical protein